MKAIQSAIMDKIRRNRISTTEIADCMGKTGAVPNVEPINRGHFRIGPVFWVYAYNESNWDVHKQLREVPEGCVVLIETFNCNDRAIFGELVSKFLFLYRQVSALVVRGRLRDVPHLIKENWPIWYEGPTPIGCFNRDLSIETPFDPVVLDERTASYRDAIAVCDDSGVVVIREPYINEAFLKKLDWIEEQEDIWFDCIDRRKWDTYDTVCLKKYQDNQ